VLYWRSCCPRTFFFYEGSGAIPGSHFGLTACAQVPIVDERRSSVFKCAINISFVKGLTI